MDEEDKKSENDVMLWVGGGALILAATAVTIYVIQKKREEELNVMRGIPVEKTTSATEIITSGRKTLTGYWNTFSKAVMSLLGNNQSPLEVTKVGNYDGSPEAVYGDEKEENN
uniref:Uncharacterized protein n=1 Tax=viral metagenome TaxID=1070528 RepID=A0A6C0CHJ1_9ZZZZ